MELLAWLFGSFQGEAAAQLTAIRKRAKAAVGRTQPLSKAKFGLRDYCTPETDGTLANNGVLTPEGATRIYGRPDFRHRALVAVDRSGRANFKLSANAIV